MPATCGNFKGKRSMSKIMPICVGLKYLLCKGCCNDFDNSFKLYSMPFDAKFCTLDKYAPHSWAKKNMPKNWALKVDQFFNANSNCIIATVHIDSFPSDLPLT
jgi:hypothetical protein